MRETGDTGIPSFAWIPVDKNMLPVSPGKPRHPAAVPEKQDNRRRESGGEIMKEFCYALIGAGLASVVWCAWCFDLLDTVRRLRDAKTTKL